MKNIKMIIFDLDGTLVNTLEDLAVSTNEALKLYGYQEHSIEAYRHFVGNGIYKLIERALPKDSRTEETVNLLKEAFITYYDAHLTDYTNPYEGIEEMLEKLKEEGIQLAVVTNKPHVQALRVVEACFKPGTFMQVVGQQDGVPHKPDPTVIRKMLDTYGLVEEEVLYIGDSDVDMQTARNAKLRGIGVAWGFRGEEELRENGAYAVLEKAEELLQYIK